jgi:hypothetical protein
MQILHRVKDVFINHDHLLDGPRLDVRATIQEFAAVRTLDAFGPDRFGAIGASARRSNLPPKRHAAIPTVL